jgi:hypothetical protein
MIISYEKIFDFHNYSLPGLQDLFKNKITKLNNLKKNMGIFFCNVLNVF